MNLGEPMKIMTYNLRFANERDVHPWSQRRSLMIDMISTAEPAILGTQEGLRYQLDDITAGLPPWYAWVGQGRSVDRSDEFCAVFYDARLLEVLDVTQRWLSTTPEVPGSLSWGACPRILTAVSFRLRKTGDELLVINTHLDHMSVHARRFAADYLLNYVRTHARGRTTIVMGDFNTAARVSAVYRRLCDTPLVDTFEVSLLPGVDGPTFNNYQSPPRVGHRIDWILVSPEVHVETSCVNTRAIDGQYASDHMPVEATIRLARSLQRAGAQTRPGRLPVSFWADDSDIG